MTSITKTFLINKIDQIRLLAVGVVREASLVNKPWAVIDEDFEIQKLIFKKGGKLILSKNGNVIEGSWEYLPEANSLIIDRGGDKILCNALFFSEEALILKLDGTENQYFALANQNLIPNLDLVGYFRKRINAHFAMKTFNLLDNRKLTIYSQEGNLLYECGDAVSIDDFPADNGLYLTKGNTDLFIIAKNKLASFYKGKHFQTPDNITFTVFSDKYVYDINGMPGDGVFGDKDTFQFFEVQNGIIKRHYFEKLYKYRKTTFSVIQKEEFIQEGDTVVVNDQLLPSRFLFLKGIFLITIQDNIVIEVADLSSWAIIMLVVISAAALTIFLLPHY